MTSQKIIYSEKIAEYEEKHSKVFKKNGKIERKFYERESLKLQYELVKLQKWIIDTNQRLLIIFEGMDSAGKSSTIKEFNNYLNPREARSVALPKPNSKELGQWYFQRHFKQIPNAGEIVFFDRSWYNRAGIEQVFGFCTQEQHDHFYKQVNGVEEMLRDDGILFFKFYLNISHETQKNRLKQREDDPLKGWKLSELDYKSLNAYDTYEILRDKMFRITGTKHAPWCELDANDKKRARINAVRYLLSNIEYEDKDKSVVLGVDKKIVKLHNEGKYYGKCTHIE
jgi:polyphosphate kinase 2